MNRWIKLKVLLLMMSIIFLTSCVQTEKILSQSEMGIKTKWVVDTIGREVEVPEDPQRIATLYATTGHIVTMLDADEKITAVNNGLKRDKLLHRFAPSIKKAPSVMVSGTINIEELLSLKVDLVFIPLEIYEEGNQVKVLEKHKIPYIVTEFQSINEQKQMVSLIGNILNNEEEAKRYNDMYDNIIDEIITVTNVLSEDEKIRVYHSINEATCTVAEDTLPADWMKIAGGIDVSIGSNLLRDGDKYYTTLEEILLWNPDVVLCNEDGVDKYIQENPQWKSMDAVINDKVFLMPIGISRWGHKTSLETPLAIAWTAKKLYPHKFKDLDVELLTKTFYKDLFEYDLLDKELNQLMSGKNMRFTKDLK